jgi:deoxyribodipyrimidine photolyase-related protein
MRHEARFAKHPRAAMQWRNLARLDDARRREIRQQAESLRAYLTVFRRERSGHR